MHKLYDNYAFLNHYIHATINLSTKSEVNFIGLSNKQFRRKGTKAYAKIIIALFISGFTIFQFCIVFNHLYLISQNHFM